MPDTATSRPAAPDAEALLQGIGARVRTRRKALGLTRAALSDASGVSPRFLAQLEAGQGNISIARLAQVATALDRPVSWFLSDAAARLWEGMTAAPADVQAQVRALLSADAAPRAQRLCLIGLRGAGKSTLGAAAGQALGLPFIELNRAIEDAAGMPIAEIMALYGQEGYRAWEAQALDTVAAEHDRVILAVAGGIVGEPDTYARLLAKFHTIWIKAAPEEHMTRVRAQGDTRPMADNPQAMAQLRSILAGREAQYARAAAALDTSGAEVPASLAALLELIAAHRFLETG